MKISVISGKYRVVFILGKYAYKFPSIKSTKLFLLGLLSNLSERTLWKNVNKQEFNNSPYSKSTRLNPTLFTFPFGLFSVQPALTPLSNLSSFNDSHEDTLELTKSIAYVIQANGVAVENSIDSFAVDHNNELFVVDYGGNW